MILMNKHTIGYRINGNLNTQEQQELEALLEPHFNQVGPFHFLKSEVEDIKTELEAYYNEYVWINIYRKGTDIVFDVYNTPVDERDDLDTYSDTLYAKRSGIIKNYKVSSCRVLVEQNQLVKEGDPLVTCYVEQPYTTEIIPIEDTAKGEVWADTWYEVNCDGGKKLMYKKVLQLTNKLLMFYYLGGMEFTLSVHKRLPYEKYEEVDKRVQSILFYGRISPLFRKKTIL